MAAGENGYRIERLSRDTPREHVEAFKRIVDEGARPLGYFMGMDFRKPGFFFIIGSNENPVGFGRLREKRSLVTRKVKEIVLEDIYVSPQHPARRGLLNAVGSFLLRESGRNNWCPIRGEWLMPPGKKLFRTIKRMVEKKHIPLPLDIEMRTYYEPYSKGGLLNKLWLWYYYRLSSVRKIPREELAGFVRDPETRSIFRKHFGEVFEPILEKPEKFLELVQRRDQETVRKMRAFLKEHQKTVVDGVVRFQRMRSVRRK